MSGHSHWATIKRAKGATDSLRGKLFSKLSKEITVAARMGGGDPGFNPRLRTAIEGAKAESMPADKIDRAIKKGTGELQDGNVIEEFVYEGYGRGGVAIIVETNSDNKNRTAAEIRSIFSKNEGNLAGSGSVAWMFKRKGYFLVDSKDEDAVLNATLDAGADDVKSISDGIEVICQPDKYDAVEKAIRSAKLTTKMARFTYIPDNLTPISDEPTSRSVMNLITLLQDQDDAQNVYANYDIPEEILNKLHAEI